MEKRDNASVLQRGVTGVILALSLAALAVCTWIGVSRHSCVDTETLSELTPEYVHNGLLQLAVAVCLFAAACVFMYFCKNIKRRRTATIVLLAAAVGVAGAVIWNKISPYEPIVDQKALLDAVVLYGRRQYSEMAVSYFDAYHNQMGFVVFFGFLFRHLPVDALTMITVCNCLSVGGVVCGTAILSFELFRNDCLAALTAWMTAVFVPIIIYSSYCYGTLVSLCCMLHGFAWLLMWFRRRRLWMALTSTVFFTISYVVYSGSLIAISCCRRSVAGRFDSNDPEKLAGGSHSFSRDCDGCSGSCHGGERSRKGILPCDRSFAGRRCSCGSICCDGNHQ